jgi:Glycosyl transferases group 1
VHLHGRVRHEELSEHAARWDVAMIPFLPGPLADTVDPIKVYEYLALGLPVVATGLPHLASVPGVWLAERGSLESALQRAAGQPLDLESVDGFLQGATWQRRVDDLLRALDAFQGDSGVLQAIA